MGAFDSWQDIQRFIVLICILGDSLA